MNLITGLVIIIIIIIIIIIFIILIINTNKMIQKSGTIGEISTKSGTHMTQNLKHQSGSKIPVQALGI